MDNEIVGIAIADFDAADARPRQAALLDQGGSAEAAWVLENASGGLKA